MRFSVEVQDEYVSQAGFREHRSRLEGEESGPIMSVVEAGAVRAGELVHAAALAVAELDELTGTITEVELSYHKPALADVIWPRFKVKLLPPGLGKEIVLTGPDGYNHGEVAVQSTGPFPTETFIRAMSGSIRTGLTDELDRIGQAVEQTKRALAPVKTSVA